MRHWVWLGAQTPPPFFPLFVSFLYHSLFCVLFRCLIWKNVKLFFPVFFVWQMYLVILLFYPSACHSSGPRPSFGRSRKRASLSNRLPLPLGLSVVSFFSPNNALRLTPPPDRARCLYIPFPLPTVPPLPDYFILPS